MKTRLFIALLTFGATRFLAADEPIPRNEKNLSLRNEVQLAIDHGLGFLKTQQKADGSWSATDPNHPALTALPLIAFQHEPTGKYLKEHRRGLAG